MIINIPKDKEDDIFDLLMDLKALAKASANMFETRIVSYSEDDTKILHSRASIILDILHDIEATSTKARSMLDDSINNSEGEE